MEDFKHEVITKAIDKLSNLTGEAFHGYRSEIWNVLSSVYEASSKRPLNKCNRPDAEDIAYQAKCDARGELIDRAFED